MLPGRTHMGGRCHSHSDLSFFCIIETGSCCVAQTGLELGDSPSSASNERHVPPCLVCSYVSTCMPNLLIKRQWAFSMLRQVGSPSDMIVEHLSF